MLLMSCVDELVAVGDLRGVDVGKLGGSSGKETCM